MTSEHEGKDTTVTVGATDAAEAKPKSDGRVIGGWASNDDIYLIDRACLEEDMTRASWIVKACVERAKMVLAAKSMIDSKPAA